jgi:anionic cell wall polymer biosynthesis LytR-Cps2A-Psr (LCP) family protein
MTVRTRRAIKVICIILAIILVFVGSVYVFLKMGEEKLRNELSFTDTELSGDDAYGDSAEVFYKGQGYSYNKNLINILFIGVDKENTEDESDRRADAIYLISLDTESKKVNIIAISRNTMADVDIYDMNNEFLATDKAQICVSYVYGKDDHHSAELTAKAVSRVLYDIPISSYGVLFTDSIVKIADTVGGVKVTIPEDMTEVKADWTKGKTVVLTSQDAENFVRYRKDENEDRVGRQMIFIKSFANTAKSKMLKDWSLPIDIYKKVKNSVVTNLDTSAITYLAKEAVKAEFSYHTIKGTVGDDGLYETFNVDDEALYKMVLDLFYIKTN